MRADPKKLSIAEEVFIAEILKGKSQRQAFKTAYPGRCHWKDSSIDVNACKLYNSTKVQQRLKELRDRTAEQIADRAILSAAEVMEAISQIASGDIGDYLSFRTERVIKGYDADGEPIMGDQILIEVKDSEGIDTTGISEVSLSRDGTFRFKLYERDKALYKLADLYGLDRLRDAKQKLAEAEHDERKKTNEKKYW